MNGVASELVPQDAASEGSAMPRTDETHPDGGIVFWVGAAAGWVIIVIGIRMGLNDREVKPALLLKWGAGGLVVHDALVDAGRNGRSRGRVRAAAQGAGGTRLGIGHDGSADADRVALRAWVRSADRRAIGTAAQLRAGPDRLSRGHLADRRRCVRRRSHPTAKDRAEGAIMTIIAFPGHAARRPRSCWSLPPWRSVALVSEMVHQ